MIKNLFNNKKLNIYSANLYYNIKYNFNIKIIDNDIINKFLFIKNIYKILKKNNKNKIII